MAASRDLTTGDHPQPATSLRKGAVCRVCGGPIQHGARINFMLHGEKVAHSDCGFFRLDELAADERTVLQMLDRREKTFSRDMWRSIITLWQKGIVRIVDKDKPGERYLVTLLALPLLEKLRKSQAVAAPCSPPLLGDATASDRRGGR